MNNYNICYSLDSQYSEQLAVSIASILKNADLKDNLNFYILDGGISKQDKLNIDLLKNIKDFNIKYIKINPEDFSSYPLLKDYNSEFKHYHVTIPTYFKFKLPELLPDVNKILYLDCDVIVRTSLHKLFNENIKNNSALMALDVESDVNSQRLGLTKYYNAGVMLINLNFWRKNHIEASVLNYIKENKEKILWQDQDIINVILNKSIKGLSDEWNFQYFGYNEVAVRKLSDACILHLAGRFKPWIIPFEHPVYDIYYYYLSLTAWKYKIAEYNLNCINKKLKNNFGGNETNILKTIFDEDLNPIYENISKIYDEITKNYSYTNELTDKLRSDINSHDDILSRNIEIKTDEKISKVYDEITKNYNYTNELTDKLKSDIKTNNDIFAKNIKIQTDENISKIYDEITKNYTYTENLIASATSKSQYEIEEKVSNIYNLLTNNYSSINNKIEENKNNVLIYVNAKTDEKISKVYDEITKNYSYTKELTDKIKNDLKINHEAFAQNIETKTDEKISKVYEEITKNYHYTNELTDKIKNDLKINHETFAQNIETKTNEKIFRIHSDITENYRYTEQLVYNRNKDLKEEIKRNINENNKNFDNSINTLKSNFDNYKNSINTLKSDLDNVNNSIEILKLNTDNIKQNVLIELNTKTDEKISKVYEEIIKNYDNTNNLISEKINETKEEINNYTKEAEEKIISLESKQNNNLDLKVNEIYSYTNTEVSKIFNEIKSNYTEILGKLDYRTNESDKQINDNKNEINKIKTTIEDKADKIQVNDLIKDFEQRIQNLQDFYCTEMKDLKEQFETQLNEQRIKYEQKLINMENQINETEQKYIQSRKNIFQKIFGKRNKR